MSNEEPENHATDDTTKPDSHATDDTTKPDSHATDDTTKPDSHATDDTTKPDSHATDDTTKPDSHTTDDTTKPDSHTTDDTTKPGYAAAMTELEQILEELESDDPDVDVLASRVERAATLIEVCRRRIANASIQVERVVAAIEPGSAA